MLDPKTQNWLDIAQDDFEVAGYLFKKENTYTAFSFASRLLKRQ